MAKKSNAPRLNFVQLAGAIIILVIAESSLIIAGVLPPMASYSAGNLIFTFLRLAIFAYAGALALDGGLAKAARNGAILGFASSFLISLSTLAAKALLGISVLGISVPNPGYLYLVLAITVVGNSLLGALIAVIAFFIAKKSA